MLLLPLVAKVLSRVRDVIQSVPIISKYEHIKTALIKRFGETKEERLRMLLKGMELGDKKPSQLLIEMRGLTADMNLDENILKTIWLEALPTRLQAIISANNDSLETIAEYADKIICSTETEISAVSNVNTEKQDLTATR